MVSPENRIPCGSLRTSKREKELFQIFELFPAGRRWDLVPEFVQYIIQGFRTTIVKVRASLAQTQQGRGVEPGAILFIFQSDIVGFPRCKPRTPVAVGASEAKKSTPAFRHEGSIHPPAGLCQRGGRWQGSDVVGDPFDLLLVGRVF